MAVVRISRTFEEFDRLQVQMQDDEAHPDGLMSETAAVCLDTFIKAHHAVMNDCAIEASDVTVEFDEDDGL